MEATTSRLSQIIARFKTSSWVFFGIFFMIFFSLGKIPEQKIRAWVEGSINSFLADKGLQLRVSESYLSTWAGLKFVMKNVYLNLPPPSSQMKIDEIQVSPAWLSLLSGKQGVGFYVRAAGGTLSGNLTGQVEKNLLKGFSVDVDLSKWNLGKTGLLEILLGLRGSALAEGHFDLTGDATVPSSWKGEAKLQLQSIVLENQAFQAMPGFTLQIPELRVATGNVDLLATGGGVQIRGMNLGKMNSADDAAVKTTGDIVLGKTLNSSTLNANMNIYLAPAILKSIGFLEMAMGPAKQTDGTYTYAIKGEVFTPLFQPVTAKP